MARALSPVVGSVLMLAVTVGLAAMIGVAVLDTTTTDPAPQAHLSASVDPATDRITVTHHGGDSLDVRDLRVRVTVDGQPLAHQPPVPFFAAEGFASGPTGPFNSASGDYWSAGETAGFELAGTNAPLIDAGDTVEIAFYRADTILTRLPVSTG